MESQVLTLRISGFGDKLSPTVLDNAGLKSLKDRIVATHSCGHCSFMPVNP